MRINFSFCSLFWRFHHNLHPTSVIRHTLKTAQAATAGVMRRGKLSAVSRAWEGRWRDEQARELCTRKLVFQAYHHIGERLFGPNAYQMIRTAVLRSRTHVGGLSSDGSCMLLAPYPASKIIEMELK